MLKTFGLAAATLLFLTTADTSLGAPGGAMTGGFDGHAGMMAGPRSLPRLGPHPGNGFFHGDHNFHGGCDFHGDHDFDGDHDFHHDHGFFHGDHNRRLPVWWGGWGWPYWWGDNYDHGDGYASESEAAYPPPAPEVTRPPSPPPCPELLHWDPKLGHATREKLCDQ